ncbi:chemotaxis protein CheW [Halobacillus sp. A5]|uniref:chemotaxis protein CheW n=1 Tax=Halobacillus sp. A5 TaxID=2880263 RepID=UPI0020A636F1|nr:chemotaxis protein CheW [Halobacillus sp. A5]MCP3026100.1 chemotaxis protein CheW [Halobacillus sp. A5]
MIAESKTMKVIVFQLGREEYAIPVHQVGSIERVMHITRVPRTAPFVEGVINLRGVVTPIIDLRKRFGIENYASNDNTRIIIAAIENMDVGLIVDAANDVLDFEVDAIEPPPEVIDSVEAGYVSGVVKVEQRLFILLDLSKVLSVDEMKEIEEIED